MRWAGRLVLVGSLVLTACSSGGGDASKPARNSSSASSASTQTAASAQLTFGGATGLAGAAIKPSVRCGFPDFGGPSIAVLAEATDSTMQFRVGVTAGKVSVRLGSGSGTEYHERAFEGTGVTGFDARRGAQVDSPLTEATATDGTTAGSLRAVTSIKGSIDCAGQEPGSSTMTLTGELAEGTLTAATLDQVRVECNNADSEVVIVGILRVGSAVGFAEIGLRLDGISVSDTLSAVSEHRFQSPPGTATLNGNGGHARGDAVELNATPPHTLHVEGDAVCGTAVV